MSAIRNGWQAERFVQKHLEATLPPEDMVIPLAPAFAADFLILLTKGVLSPLWAFVEVKSARDTWHALHARLTAPEEALRASVGTDHYHIYRVLTFPDGRCELLSHEP